MTMFSLAGPLGQGKAVSTAGGGTALTGTAGTTLLPFLTRQLDLIPRNFSTAVVVQWTKVPWLTVLKTTDLLVTVANMTDYSQNAQDGSTSTDVDLSSLDTLANLGAVYVGAFEPFIGVVIDVDTANANASVLTVTYRKSDNTWATTSATDGTDSGGAVDGSVTWTEPTDWIARELASIVPTNGSSSFGGLFRVPMFWTRWVFSAALDSTTKQNSWVAIPRATYAEIPSGMAWQEAVLCGPHPGPSVAGISAKTDAGTANLIVNAYGANGAYIPS